MSMLEMSPGDEIEILFMDETRGRSRVVEQCGGLFLEDSATGRVRSTYLIGYFREFKNLSTGKVIQAEDLPPLSPPEPAPTTPRYC